MADFLGLYKLNPQPMRENSGTTDDSFKLESQTSVNRGPMNGSYLKGANLEEHQKPQTTREYGKPLRKTESQEFLYPPLTGPMCFPGIVTLDAEKFGSLNYADWQDIELDPRHKVSIRKSDSKYLDLDGINIECLFDSDSDSDETADGGSMHGGVQTTLGYDLLTNSSLYENSTSANCENFPPSKFVRWWERQRNPISDVEEGIDSPFRFESQSDNPQVGLENDLQLSETCTTVPGLEYQPKLAKSNIENLQNALNVQLELEEPVKRLEDAGGIEQRPSPGNFAHCSGSGNDDTRVNGHVPVASRHDSSRHQQRTSNSKRKRRRHPDSQKQEQAETPSPEVRAVPTKIEKLEPRILRSSKRKTRRNCKQANSLR